MDACPYVVDPTGRDEMTGTRPPCPNGVGEMPDLKGHRQEKAEDATDQMEIRLVACRVATR